MEFVKYYDVLKIVEEMQEKEEINCYPYDDDKFDGWYVSDCETRKCRE